MTPTPAQPQPPQSTSPVITAPSVSPPPKSRLLFYLIGGLILLTIIATISLKIVPQFLQPKTLAPRENISSATDISGREENVNLYIDCTFCEVVKVTENVFSGPYLKAKPEKIWEIPAEAGQAISKNGWEVTIAKKESDLITLVFRGDIYFDLKKITHPISLNKNSILKVDSGTAGGGREWEIYYYEKEPAISYPIYPGAIFIGNEKALSCEEAPARGECGQTASVWQTSDSLDKVLSWYKLGQDRWKFEPFNDQNPNNNPVFGYLKNETDLLYTELYKDSDNTTTIKIFSQRS